jgi:hypothetical protein
VGAAPPRLRGQWPSVARNHVPLRVITKSGNDLASVITRLEERRERCPELPQSAAVVVLPSVSQRVEELLKDPSIGTTTRAQGNNEDADTAARATPRPTNSQR